jgi:hypothetical protein
MEYTENYFEIEVKVYDDFDIRLAIEEEEITKENIPFSFTTGLISLPLSEIISYSDFYMKGKTLEEVKKKGFDCTLIYTRNLGLVECVWPYQKFKKRLNEFVQTHTEALTFMKPSTTGIL